MDRPKKRAETFKSSEKWFIFATSTLSAVIIPLNAPLFYFFKAIRN